MVTGQPLGELLDLDVELLQYFRVAWDYHQKSLAARYDGLK